MAAWEGRREQSAGHFTPSWKLRRRSLRTLFLPPLFLLLFGLAFFLHAQPPPRHGASVGTKRICTPRFARRGGGAAPNDWSEHGDVPWPGGRSGPAVWPSADGGLFALGGMGYSGAPAGSDRPNAPRQRPTNHLSDAWRWVPAPGAAAATAPGSFVHLGGLATTATGDTMGALGRYNGNLQWPGGRDVAMTWLDPTDGALLLFGGWGYGDGRTTHKAGDLGDLWRLHLEGAKSGAAHAEFLGGGKDTNEPGSVHWPGARYGGVTWSLPAGGGLFLFGGQGYGLDSAEAKKVVGAVRSSFQASESAKGGPVYGDLNDLWSLRRAGGSEVEFQMLGGSAGTNALGRYSSDAKGGQWPGARSGCGRWHVKAAGAAPVLLLFAGWGFNAVKDDRLNDVWALHPPAVQGSAKPELRSKKAESSAATAVFLGGRREGGVGSVYAEHAAWPGSRTYPASFTAGGSHLLFGGFGFGEAGTDAEERIGRLADLW